MFMSTPVSHFVFVLVSGCASPGLYVSTIPLKHIRTFIHTYTQIQAQQGNRHRQFDTYNHVQSIEMAAYADTKKRHSHCDADKQMRSGILDKTQRT